MLSVFSRIIKGELPAFKVCEDKDHLAFLDIAPLSYGHVLVIPKQEEDYIFDISSDKYLELFKFARRVAKGMRKAVPCQRIGIAVVGLEVPHAHIHLIPLNKVYDINFDRPKLSFSDQEFHQISCKIKDSI